MIFRVSERGTFKRCRRRWDYSSPHRQNLTSVGSPVYLTFGTMIHSTLERWAEHPEEDLVELFMHSAANAVYEMKTRYLRVVGTLPSEEEVGVVYDHVELGRSMMGAYVEKWGSAVPHGYKMVQSEQKFLINIPDTWDVEEGKPHQLQGTLDGLLQHEKSGHLFILERKTYGARPRLSVLDHNDQFLSYMWAIQQLQKGQPCDGLVYDGLWKRKLEGKRKLDDLFFRTVLTRPQAEIDEYGRLLTLEANEMAGDPAIYINRQWLGCFDCPFDKLCAAESRGQDFDYIKRTFYTQFEGQEEEEEDTSGSDE